MSVHQDAALLLEGRNVPLRHLRRRRQRDLPHPRPTPPSEPVGASKSLRAPRLGRRAEAYSMYAEHAERRPRGVQ